MMFAQHVVEDRSRWARPRCSPAFVSAAVLVVVVPTVLDAATSTWTGNGTAPLLFSDPANWDSLPANDGTTDVLFPSLPGKQTVDVDTPYGIRTLKINNNTGIGYNIQSSNDSTLTIFGVGNNYTDALSTAGGASSIAQVINANLAVGGTAGIQIDAKDNPLTLNGNINLNGTSNTFVAYAGSTSQILTLNGVISNTPQTRGVTFNNSNQGATTIGALIQVNGLNTHQGQILISDATVILGVEGGTADAAGAFGQSNTVLKLGKAAINCHSAILIGGAFTVDRPIGLITPNAGKTLTATLGGSTTSASYFNGLITLGGAVGSTVTDAVGLNFVSATGGTVNVSGNVVTGGTTNTQLATLNINPSGIAWNNGSNWTGAGKVILSGTANTYAGATTVAAGTLQVDGVIASGGGDVTVNAGAILSGNGTISRQVINHGILAPGASIGTLTVNDEVVFNTGGSLSIELGGATADKLAVSSTLDITNGNLEIIGTADGVSNYVIASYETLVGPQFASISGMPAGYILDYNYQNNNQIALVVPEPATLSLLAAGGLLVGYRHRDDS